MRLFEFAIYSSYIVQLIETKVNLPQTSVIASKLSGFGFQII